MLKHAVFPLPLLLLTALLSGCKTPPVAKTSATATAQTLATSPDNQDTQPLRQCQQELDALKALNAPDYPATRQTFDHLMRTAAQYAGLRTKVNTITQETVDAMYHYRVNLLCAQINQSVLLRLAEQDGGRK